MGVAKKYITFAFVVVFMVAMIVFQAYNTEPTRWEEEEGNRTRSVVTYPTRATRKPVQGEPNYLHFDVVEGEWPGWTEDPQMAALGDDPEYFGLSPLPKVYNICAQQEGKLCEDDPNVLYSADVDYSPWILNMPNFVKQSDREWFETRAYGHGNFQKFTFFEGDRLKCPPHLYACKKFFESISPPVKRNVMWFYPFAQGKHVVLKNATNSGRAQCPRWSDPDRRSFFRYNQAPDPKRHRAVVAVTEEGDSFQHFLDTTLPKIAHTWDLIDPAVFPDISILARTSPRWPFVGQFYQKLGFKDVLPGGAELSPEKFVWPCTAPLRHPYQWQLIRKLLGIKHSNPQANKIIYLSRSLGSNFNAGRAIRNEAALLSAIETMLRKENRSEELLVFDHRKFHELSSHLELFQQARVMIGPHGGGFYNLLFCPAKTLVVEFFPNNRWDQHVALGSFWIATRSIDGRYYLLPYTPDNGEHDMTVDIPVIVDMLQTELVGRTTPTVSFSKNTI